ncbi:unnamed protein product [Staurois parvus]|uniref:Small EDRK-rich factor-like N-terminal domain-containing protein n=1 Tax=Staurois parvus TaxID=386267 RepID=A0ABN9BXB7_9NEOB|nr:unnamed protein product [Staurois parvus]
MVRQARDQNRRRTANQGQAGSATKQSTNQELQEKQVQGLMGTIHQGPDCRPGQSLNTPPAISLR